MLAVTLVETLERERCEELRARVVGGREHRRHRRHRVDPFLAQLGRAAAARAPGRLAPPSSTRRVFALEQEQGPDPGRGDGSRASPSRAWTSARSTRTGLRARSCYAADREGPAGRRQARATHAGRSGVRTEAQVEVDADLTALAWSSTRARPGGRGGALGRSGAGPGRAAGLPPARAGCARRRRTWRPRPWPRSCGSGPTARRCVRPRRELGLFEDPEIQPQVNAWRNDVLLAYLLANYVYADLEIAEGGRAGLLRGAHRGRVQHPRRGARGLPRRARRARQAEVALQRTGRRRGVRRSSRARSRPTRPSPPTAAASAGSRKARCSRPSRRRSSPPQVGEIVGPIETRGGLFRGAHARAPRRARRSRSIAPSAGLAASSRASSARRPTSSGSTA